MKTRIRILLLEDNPGDVGLARSHLAEDGLECELVHADSRAGFERALEQGAYDVILSDNRLPDFDGGAALELARQKCAETPFIVFSGTIGEAAVVEMLKRGACDFVLKDSPAHLGPAIRRALAEAQERARRREAEQELRQQLTRINLLNRITRAVIERHDLKSVFATVAQQLEEQMPADFACISSIDPNSRAVIIGPRGPKARQLADRGDLPREGTAVDIGSTALEACLAGQLVYCEDLARDPSALMQKYWRTGVRSAVSVPIVIEGKASGLLYVGRSVAHGFSAAEVEFLKSLAEQVAVAAHQARLHEDLQRAFDELHLTQQAMLRQERLNALGRMAAGITHDVNNALSPIIGYVDLLLEADEPLSPDVREKLGIVRTAAGDMARIVERMREFYRQRKQSEPLQPVDLNRLVQQVVGLTRPRWRDEPQQHGLMVELESGLQPDLPPLPGIESEIREALTNLIFNAVDAMPRGGRLGLRSRVSHGAILLEVSDTGIGMDEATRERCFEPFFSTKGERGTGLGLSMVFGVMQRHDGHVEVESEPGKGTTMRLIFPLHQPTVPALNGRHVAATRLPPLRILVIDDELLLRRLMKDMLERDGHRVTLASGGQAGLEAFRAAQTRGQPFDVVITDLGMPHVGGAEVVRALKSESPATAVILATGWGSRFKTESLPDEMDALLPKPPTLNDLRQKLAQAVAMRAPTPDDPSQTATRP
ncbi:MAG: response regulator [Verrucomicrobia bacterium]|nr:response regulator [Verrucomicrobiota bacterium]